MLPEIRVNLDLPPAERWRGLRPYVSQARELLSAYLQDVGGVVPFPGAVGAYRDLFVSPEHAAEMRAIAGMLRLPEEDVLTANLSYEAIKLVACTAFAVDKDDGPLHARNLDWWTAEGRLSRYTTLVTYHGAAGASPFTIVGWPGFVGALSGVAPGRFAITLNAVLSSEPAALAPPVTLLLRSVFESAGSFDEAVEILESAPILCDCLLLVTGTRPGEMVVIERTPTRSALRHARQGSVLVTNHYRVLVDASGATPDAALQWTSCGRYDRVSERLRWERPRTPEECFAILRDPQVRMEITAQHMLFSAATGLADVRLPER